MIKIIITFNILFLLIGYNAYSNAQQQEHISWPSLADSPWPFIRGDMQATGRSKYVGPTTKNIIWRKDMPLGILHGPIIGYNNTLYTGTDAVCAGGTNFFYAIDKDGQDLWFFETETYFPNNVAPLVRNDSTIYFGSRNHSIYALDPDGELKWRLQNAIWGWPHCYITLSKNGDLFVPSSDTLLIIDPGGIIKEKRTIEELKGRAFVFSTGGDTVFYFTGGGDQSNPGSLNAALLNGDLLWSYEFDTHNLGTPLVDNSNKVYVFGTDNVAYNNFYLYSINSDGTLSWRYRIDNYEDFSSPTMDNNGNIIFHAMKNILPEGEQVIISLDYFGSKNWETELPGDYWSNFINHGLVCDAEGKIYFGSTLHGNFYCLNKDGEILWSLYLEDYEYDSSPAIGSDGTLYIGTHLSSTFQNHERNLIAIRDTVTLVETNDPQNLNYILEQNYPNPFNSTTNIKFTIPQSGRVIITVYDLMGREVAVLLDRYEEAGNYDVIFQPKALASGIYFYTLNSGNFTVTKKLILLK